MKMLPARLYAARISFLIAVLFSLAVAGAARAEQAEVMSCTGRVEVLLKDTDDYTAAQEGMLLESGDAIRTGSGSTCELSFNEQNTNVVRLSENTVAAVSLSDDEKLELSEGEAFASISRLESGSAFEIRTPTVVSGARGTDWVTRVTAEGTDVEAINDEPYVRHFDRKGNVSQKLTVIKPGQMTTVKKFQRPRVMRPIEFERREQWQKVKQNVKKNAEVALIRRGQRPQFDRREFMRQRQKPAAMPSAERFEGKNVLGSDPARDGGVKPQDRQGFRPLEEAPGERGRFMPLSSKGVEAKDRENAPRDDGRIFKPLSSSDALRKSPEYGELKSFDDRRPIQETQKKAGRKQEPPEVEGKKPEQDGKEHPQEKPAGPAAEKQKEGAGRQDADKGRQDKIPGKNVPAPRPPADPVRR